jgi:hypothetical protein
VDGEFTVSGVAKDTDCRLATVIYMIRFIEQLVLLAARNQVITPSASFTGYAVSLSR